jgi:hypothetical protein
LGARLAGWQAFVGPTCPCVAPPMNIESKCRSREHLRAARVFFRADIKDMMASANNSLPFSRNKFVHLLSHFFRVARRELF